MRRDDDYQLDDLVRDQRRQMWIAGGILVLVAIYSALGGVLPGPGASPLPPRATPSAAGLAPAESATR
ncbi:MAG: hypothetical protein JKY65_15000 [Planctomycetes bacterium]|nr:hypothetical protein [Planctomycetota bacterium]